MAAVVQDPQVHARDMLVQVRTEGGRSLTVAGNPVHVGGHVGTRFRSAPVVRIADAKPVHLGHAGRADGPWRLYAFGGTDDTGLRALCKFLEHAPDSPVRRFTRAGQNIDAVFDLRAVFQQPHDVLNLGGHRELAALFEGFMLPG